MELNIELESKSAPRIMKAVSKISNGKIKGYETVLLTTLELLLKNNHGKHNLN